MSTLSRALAMLALAALLVGLLGTAVVLTSGHIELRGLTAGLLIGIGTAWVGTGLYAWWRRPSNRVGALMTWTGFAWLLNAFVAADAAVIFTLAVLLSNLYLAAFVHLLLAYPEGRVRCRRQRRLVAATYALALVGPIPMLISGFDSACAECPESVIQVTSSTTAGTVGDIVTSAAAIALVAGLVQVLVVRWRDATPPQRRELAPLLWSGIALMVLVAGTLGAQTVSGDHVPGVLALAGQLVFASVPFTFLAGVLRGPRGARRRRRRTARAPRRSARQRRPALPARRRAR